MLIDKKGKKRKSSFSEEYMKKEILSPSTPVSQTPTISPSKEVKTESPSVPALPPHTLDRTKVKSAVNAVLKLVEESSSKGNSLFPDEAYPIHMQITCVKVPRTPERQVRFLLPHSLVRDTNDVCLFVCDLKKGKKEDHEPTVAHYRDLLERNGVTGTIQVVPVRQLKVEYDQYELKRRLCERFEFFLTDAKVSGHVRHLLGKTFVTKKKFPVPVKMDSKNLKNEIARGLAKTVMTIHGKGNSNNVKVAHSKQSVEQIVENILAVAEGLAQEFPGGWANIRSLSIKSPKSLSVPIYMTLKSSNLLDVPRVRPKRPKAAQPVEDELSTFLGARVKVLPSGKVIVTKDENEVEEDSDTELNEILEEFKTVPKSEKKKQKTKDKKNKKLQQKAISGPVLHSQSFITTEEDGSDLDEEESEEETSMVVANTDKKKGSHKLQQKKKVAMSAEDEDDDDDIEEAESAYLSEMFQEQESSLLAESEEQSSGNTLQQKKKKQKKFQVEKTQKLFKNAVETKPKHFVKRKKEKDMSVNLKIKKKNDIPVNLKHKKRNKKAKLS